MQLYADMIDILLNPQTATVHQPLDVGVIVHNGSIVSAVVKCIGLLNLYYPGIGSYQYGLTYGEPVIIQPGSNYTFVAHVESLPPCTICSALISSFFMDSPDHWTLDDSATKSIPLGSGSGGEETFSNFVINSVVKV